jgi:hypothetical protein
MTLMVVMLACGYSMGCTEAAQTYYISEPQLQQSLVHAELLAKDKLGERVVLYSGAMVGALAGNDFVVAIMPYTQLKGNLKWKTLGLNYSYSF